MKNNTSRVERLNKITNRTAGFTLFCAVHWPYMLERAKATHKRAMEILEKYTPNKEKTFGDLMALTPNELTRWGQEKPAKKIITIKRSTLGTSIVARSPFSRKWLFNVTIAPKRESLEIETTAVNVVAKIGLGYALVATALLILGA
jgi:hypothetical protein